MFKFFRMHVRHFFKRAYIQYFLFLRFNFTSLGLLFVLLSFVCLFACQFFFDPVCYFISILFWFFALVGVFISFGFFWSFSYAFFLWFILYLNGAW